MLTEWFAAQNCDSVQIGVLFENIPGVSFFVKDLDHRLVAVTEVFAKMGLSSEEELFGKSDFDLFPLGWRAFPKR